MKHFVKRWLALVLTLSMLLGLFGVAEDLTLDDVDPEEIKMADPALDDAGDGGYSGYTRLL